jgi:hypothetical protein
MYASRLSMANQARVPSGKSYANQAKPGLYFDSQEPLFSQQPLFADYNGQKCLAKQCISHLTCLKQAVLSLKIEHSL